MKTIRKVLSVLLTVLVLLFLFGTFRDEGIPTAVPSAEPAEELSLLQDLSPAAEETLPEGEPDPDDPYFFF